jgi:predicted nucleic acid-binding protein
MVALDTNLLVYAHREDTVWHEKAREILENLVSSGVRWAVPWPCLYEFYSVVTHPKIFSEPTPPALAWQALRGFTDMVQVRLLAETDGFAETLDQLVGNLDLKEPRVREGSTGTLYSFHGNMGTLVQSQGFFPLRLS